MIKWAFAAAVLSASGIVHAYDLTPTGVQNKFGWMAAPEYVVGYALTGALLLALHWRVRPRATVHRAVN